ncbi:MAG: tetratricopeptide repeat protein [Bacteroidota bacterium]
MMVAHLTRANLLLQQGNYQEAEKELKAALEQNPNMPEALRLLAVVKLEMGDNEAGLQVAERALAADPGHAEGHYILGFAQVRSRQLDQAEKSLNEAILLDPRQSHYFALQGGIALDRKQFDKAEEWANQALALDAENMQALNLRATAQRMQGNKAGADDTLYRALEKEPDNSQSHANLGWSRLDQGKPTEALDHFREALRLDPTNSLAKSGLVEALKARYWVYRAFLSYFLWMSKQRSQVQWFIIVAVLFGNRILRAIMKSSPELTPILMPILVLIIIFALSTWVISPIFNLALFVNPYGKYALSKEDRQVARLTGTALSIALVSAIAFWILGSDLLLMLAVYAGMMMIPVSTLNSAGNAKGKRTLRWFTVGLALVGFAAIVMSMLQGSLYMPLVGGFAIGVFGFQWIANFIIMRSH